MSIQVPSFADVVDPGMYSINEAEKLALQLMAGGQRIPERCALALQGEPPPDNGRAERMLALLPRIATPERLLPLLDRLMPSSNTRIRSKVWKLNASASADLGWAIAQVEDDDARVAAHPFAHMVIWRQQWRLGKTLFDLMLRVTLRIVYLARSTTKVDNHGRVTSTSN